jgi:hypothetical protein
LIQETNNALYFLRSELLNGVTWHTFTFEKKVRDSYALPGGDMEKPYSPKCGQGKTKIDLFRDFFTKIAYVQVMNFIPVKVSTLYGVIYYVSSGPTENNHNSRERSGHISTSTSFCKYTYCLTNN